MYTMLIPSPKLSKPSCPVLLTLAVYSGSASFAIDMTLALLQKQTLSFNVYAHPTWGYMRRGNCYGRGKPLYGSVGSSLRW